jgi:glutamate---cysteine ligase / carboxylate-amine ligase
MSTLGGRRGAAQRLTLGVEEEFHLVDLSTRRLTARASEVLAALASREGTYAAELQQSVVETNTGVCSTLDDLRSELVSLRTELITKAESLGIGVAAAGTMPLPVPLQITETPRFRRMLAEYQLLVREQLICGMQVHVGIGEPDHAARLIDRVSKWLPALLALSASSPFSPTGDDTGYASTRTLIWSRWPTTGRAGSFASAAEYGAFVQNLIASGVISDAGMIYFDVRPSAHVPTLELRVCDACPSVDSAVLIAGLFRAIVARELARDAAGEGSLAPSVALERAAMWRAARSGLEGELVDLCGPRSVPAAVLVRSIVKELRGELEAQGDWEMVQALSETALARGSSAARQREVLRAGDSITDLVDALLAETRGEAPDHLALSHALPLLSGYRSPGYDEGLQPDRRPRPTHAHVLPALCAFGSLGLRERVELFRREQLVSGVNFRASDQHTAGAFPIDVVPRVLSGEEWSRIQGGTAQRARALDAFLQDVYTESAVIKDGIIPEWLVRGAPGYRAAGSAPAPGARRAHVCGFDIVRDEEGRWRVLEDNVRVPSGVAFAMQNRRLMRRVFPELMQPAELLDPEQAPVLLKRTLQECAPARVAAEPPRIILLSAGPTDAAYFEHRMLADAMGVHLVVPAELAVSEDVLWYENPGGRQRVDVVYLRIDEQLARLPGSNGAVLGPQLVSAVRAGTLTLANALGNGVADDKAIYAYVPQLIEYYLGEHPLLEQVATYHCADPEQQAEVLRRLEQLVIKPVDGYGGLGVVIGPRASDEELAGVRTLIIQQPQRWIAQETLTFSTHPTFSGDRLRPRHVDLRVFVYYGAQPVVVPAALTRVAPPGSLIVNSSRGGGVKDTWLLG